MLRVSARPTFKRIPLATRATGLTVLLYGLLGFLVLPSVLRCLLAGQLAAHLFSDLLTSSAKPASEGQVTALPWLFLNNLEGMMRVPHFLC
jgi:hypothetical protein